MPCRRSTRSRRSSRELGRFERLGTSGFLQAFVDNDPGDPERYLVFLEQGGIGLPDESYFREEKFAEIRAGYQLFLERMFSLAGLSDPAERAARVFALETEIAAQHWDNVRTRDSQATYNLLPWSEVETLGGRGAARRLARRRSTSRPARSTRSWCASPASSRGSARC